MRPLAVVFVAILALLGTLFGMSTSVEGQSDPSIDNNFAAQQELPFVSFTTTTPLQTIPENGNTYLGVVEGEIGHFAITLDRVASHDVTLNVSVSENGDKVRYTNPVTGREMDLTEPRGVTIEAGSLSVPFTFDTRGFEDEEYSTFIRKVVTQISFTYDESSARVAGYHNNHLSLRRLEDDIPTLSLSFADPVAADGVLEEEGSFDVVVGTDTEISNDRLRIEANLVAYADGVALDWNIPSVTINAGEQETRVTVRVPEGSLAELENKEIVLGLKDATLGEIGGKQRQVSLETGATLTLNAIAILSASLSTDSLTLVEGERATIAVDVLGDISSVVDETLRLVAADEDSKDDYKITPQVITLAQAQAGITFELEVLKNNAYEPGDRLVLELTSTLDTIKFLPFAQLTVVVLNSVAVPHVAFTSQEIYTENDHAYLDVVEGDVGEFAIELEHESNRDVWISVFLSNNSEAISTQQLESEAKRIPYAKYSLWPRNQGTEGWALGDGDILSDYWLKIPAGARSVTFTVNFEDMDNRLNSLRKGNIVSIYFRIEGESEAVTDMASSRLTIREVEDDTPKVSLTVNPDNPSVMVTDDGRVQVMEDSSFEVWVALTEKEVRPDFELEITLTATVTAGAELDLTLFTVSSASGATITVDVIGDDRANGNREIVFELESVILKDSIAPWFATGYELALPLPANPTITVDVIDDDVPRASLGVEQLTLAEGLTTAVQVILRGDLSFVVGETLELVRLDDEGIEYPASEGTDYKLIGNLITIDEAAARAGYIAYTIALYAEVDGVYDPDESVRLGLKSSSEIVQFDDIDELTLNIVNNEDLPTLSFVGNKDVYITEGEWGATITVALDYPSNRRIELELEFRDTNAGRAEEYGYDLDNLRHPPTVVLEAGETTTQIRFDTSLLDNDIYIWESDDRRNYNIGELRVYYDWDGDNSDLEVLVALDAQGVQIHIKDDEPRPTLLLKRGESDTRTHIEVKEGESFSVWVGFSNPVVFRHTYYPEARYSVEVVSSGTDWVMGDNIEIERGTLGTLYTFTVGDDTEYRPIPDVILNTSRIVYTEIEGRNSQRTLGVSNDFVVTIVDNDIPEASLSVEQLTLAEGLTTAVQVVLRGDLSSVVGETLELVRLDDEGIEYPAAEGTDYKLIGNLITIDEAAARAGYVTYTIALYAEVDGVYDPDESVRLGLVSSSEIVQFDDIDELTLNIVNNEDRPTLLFADRTDGWDYLDIVEGEAATITVVLDYPSNRRIEVVVEFDEDDSYDSLLYGYDVSHFSTYSVVFEAGETTAQFRFDTSLLENDIYIWDEYYRDGYDIGDFEFARFNHDDKGVRRPPVGRGRDLTIFIVDDEPEPELVLRAGKSDPRTHIEVSEGESFTIWVGLSHPYDGDVTPDVEVISSNNDWIPGSRIEIERGASGTLYTFTVEDDAEYRPVQDVTLSFSSIVVLEIDGRETTDNLKMGNDFVVTILDNDPPPATAP